MSEPNIRVLSLGAGVQSTVLALMAAEGLLPGCDAAVFADTGWEPRRVYRHLDRISTVLADAGIPLYRVSRGNLRNDALDPEHAYMSIPFHIRKADGTKAIGRRQCTKEYKIAPIRRKVRELLGAKPPHFRTVARGRLAEEWIGFSTDEIHRVGDKNPVLYARKRYPLLDLRMSRRDCTAWLDARGWVDVAKSACIGCPYTGNRGWRWLRDESPDEWADAVAFDEAIRQVRPGTKGARFVGEAYLHTSLTPLALADLKPSRRELLEHGDPDGCSPYGCRSGAPAESS